MIRENHAVFLWFRAWFEKQSQRELSNETTASGSHTWTGVVSILEITQSILNANLAEGCGFNFTKKGTHFFPTRLTRAHSRAYSLAFSRAHCFVKHSDIASDGSGAESVFRLDFPANVCYIMYNTNEGEQACRRWCRQISVRDGVLFWERLFSVLCRNTSRMTGMCSSCSIFTSGWPAWQEKGRRDQFSVL